MTKRIVRLIPAIRTQAETAKQLGISRRTVRAAEQNAIRKLNTALAQAGCGILLSVRPAGIVVYEMEGI